MKTFHFAAAFLTLFLLACTQKDPLLGGDVDKNGCLSAAGQTKSFLKNACVQLFDVADIRFTDPQNPTLAVYVILSEDRQQAEVFSSSFEKPLLMMAVKGGYVSDDNQWLLLNRSKGWRLVSR